MSAQGEDLLAWLAAAITAREQAARAAADAVGGPSWDGSDREVSVSAPGNDTIADGVMYGDLYEAMKQEACDHIAANDPASVLRRCAADRKLVAAFRKATGPRSLHTDDPRINGHREGRDSALLQALRFLAEGYGWNSETSHANTGAGQTPPTEGDQVT
ncbi:DUF6221 family protein [Streptomyces albidoflavus]